METTTLPTHEFKDDHDVIVAMYVKMGRVEADIKELKDTTSQRVAALEHEKMNKDEVLRLKHEADEVHDAILKRLSSLESWRWLLVGAWGLIMLAVPFILKYLP